MAVAFSLGLLVMEALTAGAATLSKGMLGAAAKDAYDTLKGAVARIAGIDPAAPDATPAATAGKVDGCDDAEMRAELATLARALIKALEAQKEVAPTVDIDELQAIDVKLGEVIANGRTGLRVRKVRTRTFTIDTLGGGGSGNP